jgi:hypothetical protein
MSAEIVNLGHERLKQQLSLSIALLNAEGLTLPKPETDLEYAERIIADASETLRSGDLMAAASALEAAARYLRRLEAMPRERTERNRKRRERRKSKRAGTIKGSGD